MVLSNYTESTHSKGGCSEFRLKIVLKDDNTYPGAERIGIFYFRLFLLSRKASNATIKLPKDIIKPNIPMKIVMIS